MRRNISIWPVVALLGCLLTAFIWYNGQLVGSAKDLEEQYNQSRIRLTQLQNDQVSLKEMRDTVGSEAFIEYQARTRFGYMKQDEIRFVITNPEVLYGPEDIPVY